MNDYIKRQDVIEVVRDILKNPNCPISIAATIERVLMEIPSSNVREDVQGKWSRHGFSEDGDLRDTCSVCGHSFYEHLKVRRLPMRHYHGCGWKYCPNCGARMENGEV